MYNVNCKQIVYNIIVVYLYAILFGGFILKKIGLTDELGLKIMACLDFIPLVLFFISNPSFYNRGKNIFKRKIFWLSWILLLLLLCITNYIHSRSLIPSIIHVGALLRYVPLAYIIISLSYHYNIKEKLLYHLKAITIIMLLIMTACILLGHKAEMFLPVMGKGATGLREISSGYYSGVFPNTIDLSFLLLILFIIWCNDKRLSKGRFIILSLWMGICIFKTGSATATALFCMFLFFKLTENQIYVRYMLILFIGIEVIALYFKYQYEVSLVIDNMQLSRLGIISITAPNFITEFSFDTFWGIGNDEHVVLNKVNSYPEKVHMLYYTESLNAFGDVYWVALLIFHGLIGLCIIGYIFYLIYKGISKYNITDKYFNFKRIIKWSYIAIFLLGLMNQVLVVKTFAIVFWILVAIVYSSITNNRINHEDSSNKQLCLS